MTPEQDADCAAQCAAIWKVENSWNLSIEEFLGFVNLWKPYDPGEEVTHVCISVIDSCVGALSIDGLGRRTFKPGEEAMIQAPWVDSVEYEQWIVRLRLERKVILNASYGTIRRDEDIRCQCHLCKELWS